MLGSSRYIQHAAKLRPDLRRQPYPLPLAARKRSRRTAQRQIPKPDRIEKLQPALDLFQYKAGDLFVAGTKFDRVKSS